MSVCQACELQSSLSACREELNLYLQQMEEVKKNYKNELQWNNDKVWCYITMIRSCSYRPPCLIFHPLLSPLLRRIFSLAPPSPGVFSAGKAPQCQPGLSEHQWAEPAASAFSPAAADHADWEHRPHRWAGGEPEPAAETSKWSSKISG